MFNKRVKKVGQEVYSRLQPTTVDSLHDGRLLLKKDPITGSVYFMEYIDASVGGFYRYTALSEEEASHALRSRHSLGIYERTWPQRWILNDGRPSEYTLRTRRSWWRTILQWLRLRKRLTETEKSNLYYHHLHPTEKYSLEHGIELRKHPEDGTVYLCSISIAAPGEVRVFTSLSASDAHNAMNDENSLDHYAKYGRWQSLLSG